jgi:hypothetical protein
MEALRLQQEGALRIDDPAGLVVEVSRGEVWLTQERDPRDYFLRTGDWMRIDRPQSVVLSALRADAWICLFSLNTDRLSPGRPQSLLLLAPGQSLAVAREAP